MEKMWGIVILIGIVEISISLSACQNTQVKQNDREEIEQVIVLTPNIFSGVVKQIIPSFEKANPGCKIKTEVCPVRPMLEDILNGKITGDVFLSMGDVELLHLYEKNLAKRNNAKHIAQTSLVALTMPGNPLDLKELKDIANPQVKKISVPDPKFNSAGKAFIETAKKIGIYEKIKTKLHFVLGPRTATKAMEEGKAQVCITHNKCYLGHAKRNALIQFIPTELHQPIICKAVILTGSTNFSLAEKFIEFLCTDASQTLFEKAKFGGIK